MKLLILTPSFPDKHNRFYGGIFVKEQVEALSKYADEINVVSPVPFSLGIEYKDKVCKDYSFDNVNVYFPRFLHLPLGYFRKRRGEREAKVIEKTIQKKNIKFDLIHAHFTWPSGYAGAKLSKKFSAPLIITAHGYDVYSLPFKNNAWFERIKFSLDSADHVITVGRSNYEILVNKLRIQENKISIIPNGFDSSKFKPIDKISARKTLGLPLDNMIMLNVANLVPVKGHRYLIEAMKYIIKVRDDTMLVIVGDGPLKKELENQIKKLGLDGYIKLVGAKPHEEISLWMNAADLFVLPSLSEGNPTVMFEALGVGLSFVGTAVGGVPEIITSEDYGLLCPPADPECLAEKILIALEKDWDREKIRKYAKQFTWEEIARKTFEVYNGIVGKRG